MDKSIAKELSVPKQDFWELMGSGIIKYFEERLFTPIIGNGDYLSGAVKLGIGYFIPAKGSVLRMSKTAFVMDGVEDLLTKTLSGFSGANNNSMIV